MTGKTLRYKGYRGTVEFSESDNCLYGQIIGIKGAVMFEGQSIEELKEDFHTTVDSYIEACKEWGITP